MHNEWKQDLKEKELLFVVSCAMSDSRQTNAKTCNKAEVFLIQMKKYLQLYQNLIDTIYENY